MRKKKKQQNLCTLWWFYVQGLTLKLMKTQQMNSTENHLRPLKYDILVLVLTQCFARKAFGSRQMTGSDVVQRTETKIFLEA